MAGVCAAMDAHSLIAPAKYFYLPGAETLPGKASGGHMNQAFINVKQKTWRLNCCSCIAAWRVLSLSVAKLRLNVTTKRTGVAEGGGRL